MVPHLLFTISDVGIRYASFVYVHVNVRVSNEPVRTENREEEDFKGASHRTYPFMCNLVRVYTNS